MVCNIMKTYKISPNHLRFFLDISTIYEAYGYEGCDSEYTELCSLNFANRNSVRRWVNEYLRPLFQEYSPARQLRIKESFRYGLNFWSDETLRGLCGRLAGRHKPGRYPPTLRGNLERPVRRRTQRY